MNTYGKGRVAAPAAGEPWIRGRGERNDQKF